jgi:3-vinyl bacteriochlorophyllide hydratase
MQVPRRQHETRKGLYTDAERRRRDSSPWTVVQAILAPLQFLIFIISLGLILRTLATGEGGWLANASVLVKTMVLYTIMVTGSLWEKDVFGKYLFAPAFFWEDAVSFVVIALHTAYIICLMTGWLDGSALLILALVAYAAYMLNAAQFLLKLRAARLERQAPDFNQAEAAS